MDEIGKVVDWIIMQSTKLSYFLIFVLGFALDAPDPVPTEGFSWSNLIYRSLKTNAWLIIVLSLFIIAFKNLYLWAYKDRKELKEKAEEILNHSRRYFIKEKYLDSDPEYNHRLTLFRHTRFCYWPRPRRAKLWHWGSGYGPLKGWLVPVARSAHSTKTIKSTFKIPDDAHGAEGVAGKAFFQEKPFRIPAGNVQLPCLSQSSTESEIEDFARDTFVDKQWVRSRVGKEKLLARSLFAFRIKIDGKPWGVVVVDSVAPDGIHNSGDLIKPISYLRYLIKNVVEGR